MGRRTESTGYLKECIADALIRLMEDTSIDRISIQELTALAGVGRMSYFRFFQSKDDVLGYKLRLLWTRWASSHPYPNKSKSVYLFSSWFLSFLSQHQELIALLYRDGRQLVLLDSFLRILDAMADPLSDASYRRAFTAYGLFGVASEWASGGFLESPEELAVLCASLAGSSR